MSCIISVNLNHKCSLASISNAIVVQVAYLLAKIRWNRPTNMGKSFVNSKGMVKRGGQGGQGGGQDPFLDAFREDSYFKFSILGGVEPYPQVLEYFINVLYILTFADLENWLQDTDWS